MANQIKQLILSDGTVLEWGALACIVPSYNDDGTFKNLQIVTESGHKINIESGDNVAVKPMGNLQHDTAHYPEGSDKSEFKMKAICDDKNHVEGYNIEAAGVKFITKAADTAFWDPDKWVLKIQKSATKYSKGIINAASWDIRARATAIGTGGGIAVQIASCDSGCKENKFKIETDRIKDVSEGLPQSSSQWESFYNGEGGKGIEIGTVNSQFESFFTKTIRRNANSSVYAVTRGALTTVDGKTDFPTQSDDSKDIISSSHPDVKWIDLINAAAYLKAQGLIPSDGTFYSGE